MLSANTRDGDAGGSRSAALTHVCLITGDVPALARFYAAVLRAPAELHGDQYAEVAAGGFAVSFFRADAMERLAPGTAVAGCNRGMILEFRVADVDAEYARLDGLGVRWVKPPTTQAWGNRSVYFADPDGNLINFYTRVG